LTRLKTIRGGCGLSDRRLAAESRDTEHAIRLWHHKAANGCPPDLTAFDFQRLQTDWGYRFLISSDAFVGAAVFIIYGVQFARLLRLPDRADPRLPMLQQLPARYRDLFVEGCDEVLVKSEPARFSGAVRHDGDVELYRAAFMPLQGKNNLRPLIYGTFNRRSVPITALRGTFTSECLQAERLYEREAAAE
jgi:hypothetical protein